MEYEDRVRIATPEGVEIEVALAGIGSRLSARLIDLLIQAVIALVVVIALGAGLGADSVADGVIAAVAIVCAFGVFWAYDVCFETFNGGRTPGKGLLGIRVVGDRGEPVTFPVSAIRNVLRIVDEYLTLWLGALISIVRSRRDQRLGDMAAGTLVVKDRRAEATTEPEVGISALGSLADAERWDTTGIGDDDLAAARRYLERRGALPEHVRTYLAGDLAARLRPKVPAADPNLSDEQFLELLVVVLARRRR